MRKQIARQLMVMAGRLVNKVRCLRPQHFHRFSAVFMVLGGCAGLVAGAPWQSMLVCFAGAVVALAYAKLHTIEDRFDPDLID